jgi:hypothetical protein
LYRWTSWATLTFDVQTAVQWPQVNNGDAADEDREGGDAVLWKSVPKAGRRQVRGKFRARRAGDGPIGRRPDEHIERGRQRNEDEQSRTERLGAESKFLKNPVCQILIGDEVATPAADPAAQDQREQDRETEEDEAGIDAARRKGTHRFGWFDRRDRAAGPQPLQRMGEHEDVNGQQ